MADAAALEQDGMAFARKAVSCDERQEYKTAMFYYTVSKVYGGLLWLIVQT